MSNTPRIIWDTLLETITHPTDILFHPQDFAMKEINKSNLKSDYVDVGVIGKEIIKEGYIQDNPLDYMPTTINGITRNQYSENSHYDYSVWETFYKKVDPYIQKETAQIDYWKFYNDNKEYLDDFIKTHGREFHHLSESIYGTKDFLLKDSQLIYEKGLQVLKSRIDLTKYASDNSPLIWDGAADTIIKTVSNSALDNMGNIVKFSLDLIKDIDWIGFSPYILTGVMIWLILNKVANTI